MLNVSRCYGARCHDVMLIVTCHTHVILCQLIKPIQWNVPCCHLNIIRVREAPGVRSDPGGDNVVTIKGQKPATRDGVACRASYSSLAAEKESDGERSSKVLKSPVIFVYLSMERRKKKLLSLTLFRLVIPILTELPVVVLNEFVVVVLGPALGPLQSLITLAVVLVAVEALVPQGKEVTGSQLLSTSHAHKTLQPDNFISRPVKRFVG